ncbi:hypothetical protein [Streptomyces sp. NPDC048309]|uniref:hypothetical protein n=1 Tax=Streptomyces sp. NPDC048309 TaxID=3154618 RepID=UPI00340BE8E6
MALVVLAVSGCGASGGSDSAKAPQKNAVPNLSLYAQKCSKDVRRGLELVWNVSTGGRSGVDEEQEAAAIQLRIATLPEKGIYDEYQGRGLRDIVQWRSDHNFKGPDADPVRLMAKYGPQVDKDCGEAYPQ